MIGSPNHGTDITIWGTIIGGGVGGVIGGGIPGIVIGGVSGKLALNWKAGIAGREMESHTPFLNWLNGNDNCADLQYGTYNMDKSNRSVHYYLIGSHAPLPLTFTHSHKLLGYDFLWYSFTPDGDGLTADNSLKLTGVSSNDIAIIPNVWHGEPQMDSVDVIEKAVSDIRGDASSSVATVASQTPSNVATQLSSSAQGVIKPNEVKTQTVFIDNTAKKAYFNLFWPGSNMDLVLYTPSGAKINSSIASNNPNINYTSGAIFKSYEVLSPESGNWKMEITAVNVTSTGENYSTITLIETNLFVGAGTNKESYAPNEPITVAAYVQDNGTPITKVNVTATISRPDGTNSTIQLFDDGLHNDNKTSDGIYANMYTGTNVSGEYYIVTTANGNIGNESFERKAFKNVWVEITNTPTPSITGVTITPTTPSAGNEINITVAINNSGASFNGRVEGNVWTPDGSGKYLGWENVVIPSGASTVTITGAAGGNESSYIPHQAGAYLYDVFLENVDMGQVYTNSTDSRLGVHFTVGAAEDVYISNVSLSASPTNGSVMALKVTIFNPTASAFNGTMDANVWDSASGHVLTPQNISIAANGSTTLTFSYTPVNQGLHSYDFFMVSDVSGQNTKAPWGFPCMDYVAGIGFTVV